MRDRFTVRVRVRSLSTSPQHGVKLMVRQRLFKVVAASALAFGFSPLAPFAPFSPIARAADLGMPFKLEKGDHICYVGNTLPDRMQHFGWLETLIYSRFPNHDLVFRDLGYSGDEINHRERCDGFGAPPAKAPPHKARGILSVFCLSANSTA